MPVFAHTIESGAPELLADHLAAVGARAAGFAQAFGWGSMAEAAGRLHDIGKCSDQFQAYLKGRAPSPDHSTAGARVAMARYGPLIGKLLAFGIAGHHAGLADGRGEGDLADRLLDKRVIPAYDGWEAHAGALPSLEAIMQARPRHRRRSAGLVSLWPS